MAPNVFIYLFAVIVAACIIGIYVIIGRSVGSKDTNNDIKKSMGAIAAILAVVIFFFGVMTYLYFMQDMNAAMPYLLLSQPVLLFICLYSLAASSLSIMDT